ncbi:arginine--tRNA ligase [Paenibacillus yonginensis]|uniref:arginine--tRNA ligase n=1 Tax=Paenibacillus yonginensis TaxID=1462996 RepID=A0A1B1N6Z1_9BACL|nr:arginine--tRNA ligase [Paenibacillus yonginensis]ANS77196.1 arginine--tRNA ligase [Paenibacillus yonginensis]
MLNTWVQQFVESGVEKVLHAHGEEGREEHFWKVQIEQPSKLEHGDFSTNIAMQLAKLLRRPPMLIAEQIGDELSTRAEGLIAKVEVAAPGFINLFVNWGQWAKRGQPANPPSPLKIVVEHTSINPNKSAHIGHLRNSCIGDTLVRMLRKSGAEVEVHNYIDDLGNQLADTVVGLLHTPASGDYKRFGDFCWDVYSGLHKQGEDSPELTAERTKVLHGLEQGTGNLAWLGFITASQIVREHLEEMREFGIGYDLLVWESSIVREGFWDAAFQRLQQTPNFVRETSGKLAGCWVLKPQAQPSEAGVKQQEEVSEAEGETVPDPESDHNQDKVLVRSNGILTYTAKDIAYHLWKFGLLGRQFRYTPFAEGVWSTARQGTDGVFGHADKVINVIDRRQEYPQAMVRQSLELMGYEEQAANLLHVSYGVVSLSRNAALELGMDVTDGKSSYAMSGRQGIGMKISALLDRMEQVIADSRPDQDGLPSRVIAAAAIRYYLLRFNLQTEVVFDLQQATEISGNTGVYLLYTYSRSLSVLNKGAEQSRAAKTGARPDSIQGDACGHGPSFQPAAPMNWPDSLEPAEHALLRQIAAWPDVLQTACSSLAPHMICGYGYELCSLFNNFYGACPIIKAASGTKEFRLWLTSCFNSVLKEVLDSLGLPAPERM